jgi:hypothetical protein
MSYNSNLSNLSQLKRLRSEHRFGATINVGSSVCLCVQSLVRSPLPPRDARRFPHSQSTLPSTPSGSIMRSPHTVSYATGPHYRTPHPRAPPRHLCCPLPRPRTNIAILRFVNKGKRTIYNLAIAMQQRSLAAASVAMAPDITLDQVPCWSDPD